MTSTVGAQIRPCPRIHFGWPKQDILSDRKGELNKSILRFLAVRTAWTPIVCYLFQVNR